MTVLHLLLLLLVAPGVVSAVDDIASLLPARLQSVVAVEFTIHSEIDRRQVTVAGTVVDERGTIVIPGTHILPGHAVDQLRDFKIYRPNSDESVAATYLGQDALTGFHFVRVSGGSSVTDLTPLTTFTVGAAPQMGDEVWGLGLRGKDEDFAPYLLSGRVALLARLPNRTALAAQDLASPGLPVFDRAGNLVGLAMNPFGQNFLLFSRNQHGTPVMLINAEESSVVLLAEEFLPHLQRVPQDPSGRPISWLGVYGIQPVDPEVAKLLALERQSGLVLSDIAVDSPAARAGLQDRDIVLAVDGKVLPRLKPDRVVASYFGQQILKRLPGERMRLTILRGAERREVEVTLGDEPRLVREAERRYFDRLGFTVREFLVADQILHRAKHGEHSGVVVHFLKPNSPAATVGLRPDDWIREIDGTEVRTYAEAVGKLAALESDTRRAEFVLLTSRGGETQVLRIKLN